jgi:uncharacterized protein (TIGR02391 family)
LLAVDIEAYLDLIASKSANQHIPLSVLEHTSLTKHVYNSHMAAIPKIDETKLEAICAVIGDTAAGLTGSEIGRVLTRCNIQDPSSGMAKRHRLFEALRARQANDGCANNVLAFIQIAMDPVRFQGNRHGHEELRDRLNESLAFSGFHLGEDGKLRQVPKAETLSEAQARASRLRQQLMQRRVHPDVLRFCKAELLQENYFHAVFEATKSVAQKIRDLTGLTTDGADLVDEAFRIIAPRLAINSLTTDTEQSEQRGFINLLKGMFGTFRNVTGHAPKISWPINEEDALDLLSLVSYLHRRLDAAARVPRLP